MSDKNKPAIRFKGFDGAWKLCKLSEYLTVSNEKNLENNYSYEDVLSVSGEFGVVNQIEFKGRSFAGASVSNYGIANTGDIVYTKSPLKDSPFGIIKANKGKPGIVSVLYGVYHPNEKCCANFVQAYYELNTRLNNYLKTLVNKGAKNTLLISDTDALQGNVNFPQTFKEQEKISDLFEKISLSISLHQQKYAKLVCIKQALLDKMFPKEGCNVPEIRFKGFTEEWEKRKLGEVANVYDGVHQTPDYKDSGIMFLSVENISTLKSEKYISKEAFLRDYKVYPQKGDILMTRIGDVGTPNVVESSEKVAFYVSLALLKPTGIDSYFLCNSILSPSFQKGLINRTLVTAIPKKINKNEIGKVEFLLPDNSDEQKQIGAFFKHLDRLTTLQEKKLDKLKKLKQALLDKMFV